MLFEADRLSQLPEVITKLRSLLGELFHQVGQPVGDRVQLALGGLLVAGLGVL
jgi:hypothetical protein